MGISGLVTGRLPGIGEQGDGIGMDGLPLQLHDLTSGRFCQDILSP